MAGYHRFVSYIYLYENGEKTMNTGFAKVENRDGQCRIDVSLRNVCAAEDDMHRVYMFVREQETLLGIYLGEIGCKNGVGVFSCVTDEDDIEESGYGLEQISGMIVKSDQGKIYGTGWDDRAISVENFKEFGKVSEDLHVENIQESDNGIVNTIETVRNEIYEDIKQSINEENDDCDQPLHGIQRLLEEGLRMYPFEDDQVSACIRMEPQELGQLPMQYWYVMNNSFLLHGYYSYRHLILARMTDGQIILGVPGVNYERERLMAECFGFEHFKSVQKKENKGVVFGYWYMPLDV